MGSVCGGGGSSSQTTTNSSSPPPQTLANYQAGINRATAVANTPFTPYPGEQVAPLSNQTVTGLSNLDKYAYAAQPYLDQSREHDPDRRWDDAGGGGPGHPGSVLWRGRRPVHGPVHARA